MQKVLLKTYHQSVFPIQFDEKKFLQPIVGFQLTFPLKNQLWYRDLYNQKLWLFSKKINYENPQTSP